MNSRDSDYVTPASFSTLMHVPSCPREIQWMALPWRPAASFISGNVSSLAATIVTSWPCARAASSTRNGNRPFPAMSPSFISFDTTLG